MGQPLIGESLLSAMIDTILNRLTSPDVLCFVRWQEVDGGLLEKLKKTMNTVNVLLGDAEEKQISDETVETRADDIQDALFEAEDLMDEIGYMGRRLEVAAASRTREDQVTSFSSSLFVFNNMNCRELLGKLEKVVERLNGLVKLKDDLDLVMGIDFDGRRKPFSLTRSPLGNGFGVFGRETDVEAIMKLLMLDDENGSKIGVIPIMGAGGVGKTTLARLVFDDSRVEEWFDVKIWVWVAQEFDVSSVIENILWRIGEYSWATDDTLLKEKLKAKKFLLVLDNIRNVNCWEILLQSLRSGARGSKVIVTTQHESVANFVQTVNSPYHLKGIDDDSCWLLFSKHAFSGGNFSSSMQLLQIGKEIARKCKGLPLGIRAIGCIMRENENVSEWVKISNSSMWSSVSENIPSALRLSYHCLSSHLKRCFAYCAIFPKGHRFAKEELILLWMAEGFLLQPKGGEKIEEREIGENYFDYFISMSFFQQSDEDPSRFFMHDLVNELAKCVSGEACISLESNNSRKASVMTRYLSYSRTKCDSICEISEHVQELHPMRTFLSSSEWRGSGFDDKVFRELLCTFSHLRVLSLPFYYKLTRVPDTIGNMKHLRHLNLSNTYIVKLPETVTALYNLQTLLLRACHCLRELPANMMKLINLEHLDIKETQLGAMPLQMGKLIKLQRLTDFFLGKQRGSSIKELRNLKHLGGELYLWDLQNVDDVRDALEANLKGKKNLKSLKLMWHDDNDDNDDLIDEKLLEHLQPHTNLECLTIFGYRGAVFSDWVGDTSFSNIVSLELSGCNCCVFLPPLGQLSSLKNLWIKDFDAVMTVGAEFYGSCPSVTEPFRSLEILGFEKLPQWREWSSGVSNFPVLQKLYIRDCPKLREALPRGVSSLTELEILGCQQLSVSLPREPTFRTLTLKDDSRYLLLRKLRSGVHSLTASKFQSDSLLKEIEQMEFPENFEEICLSFCDSLELLTLDLLLKSKHFKIHRCPNLVSLDAHESPLGGFTLTPLTSLLITECRSLESFPHRGLAAPNLRQLHLEGCSKLKLLPESMHSLLHSLVNLEIISCPELELFPEGDLPDKLKSLTIYDCSKLIAGRMRWGLQRLPSLSYFSIGKCRDAKSFPDKTLLPSSLTSLSILQFTNLKSLDYNGLQHLTCLRKLTIRGCPGIESMPDEGLPSTLEYLKMWDLPKLEGLDYKWLQDITSLRKLKIWECPKLDSVPKEGLPSSLCSLSIYDCPSLEQRCQPEKGEDWPKICHIPYIKFQM